jgi:hypothetical protein
MAMIATMRHPRLVSVLAGAGISATALFGAPATGPVTWAPHDIDANFRGGYAVSAADFNKDGKVDVIANSLQATDLAWYENPSWTRHVIVADTKQIVNQAMADIDGDQIPEVAFQSGFAMQPANSPGLNWVAKRPADPAQPWVTQKIDEFPTSHHIVWADLDGDGKKELLNAPLLGPKGLAPTYDQDKASVFWYRTGNWTRHVMADDIPGIIHRIRVAKWDGTTRDQIFVASFEGVAVYRASGSGEGLTFKKELLSPGHTTEKAPRLGASDVGIGAQDGKRFFASVEPWHGNEVVVYTEKAGRWERRVIFDKVASGHEIVVADLNGDGRADIVANDNSRPTETNPNARQGGVHAFYAPDDAAAGEWKYQRIEEQAAMNSCVAADVNVDKRPDVICVGAGGVLRWYENKGK